MARPGPAQCSTIQAVSGPALLTSYEAGRRGHRGSSPRVNGVHPAALVDRRAHLPDPPCASNPHSPADLKRCDVIPSPHPGGTGFARGSSSRMRRGVGTVSRLATLTYHDARRFPSRPHTAHPPTPGKTLTKYEQLSKLTSVSPALPYFEPVTPLAVVKNVCSEPPRPAWRSRRARRGFRFRRR